MQSTFEPGHFSNSPTARASETRADEVQQTQVPDNSQQFWLSGLVDENFKTEMQLRARGQKSLKHCEKTELPWISRYAQML